MDNKINVLMTGAGAPGAPGIIKSLRLAKQKIRIVGVDMNTDSVGFAMADKGYIIPSGDDNKFIPYVLEICKNEHIQVLLPLVTRELIKLSLNKDKFEEIGTKVSISPPNSLKIANNKYLLMKFCRGNGIGVPEFMKVHNFNEFEQAVFTLGYPAQNVCFKPPVSNGQRGFRILTGEIDRFNLLMNEKPMNVVTTFEDVKSILKSAKNFPELIVMEYLPGKEYSVDVLAKDGEPITIIPRLREKLKMGISFVGKTVNNDTIFDASERIVRKLKLNGNVGLQFKEDGRGVPKIIESNPRLQGTTVLCTAAGANLVYLAVKLALGEKITSPKVRWGIKMMRYWEEVYYDENGHAYTL